MLQVVTSETALNMILDSIQPVERTQVIPLEEAPGRIVAEDIFSPEDLPAFHRSTVDGYALRASDSYGCSETIPAMLLYDGEIRIGEMPQEPLPPGHCIRISTGAALPQQADAVCMVEYSDDLGDEYRYLYKPVSVLENVNCIGDDCRKGSLLLPKGTCIQTRHVAILAALGISQVRVFEKPVVGILSTGDELVEYTKKPEKCEIRDINSVMLASQVKEAGGEPVLYPLIRDEIGELTAAVCKAVSECNLILLSGGSSVGEKDHTFLVLKELGEIRFHGISLKPGKPTLYATVEGKPVFGLPGHPQAAFFVFRLFAAPALWKMAGREEPYGERTMVCRLARNVPSDHGREEIIPVKIMKERKESCPAGSGTDPGSCAELLPAKAGSAGESYAEPLPAKAGSAGESYAEPLPAKSGVVSVLSRADGYLRIGRDTEGLAEGAEVTVYLL